MTLRGQTIVWKAPSKSRAANAPDVVNLCLSENARPHRRCPMFTFSRLRAISGSPDWRRILRCAVGGLTEVGFSQDEALMLVVSHAGRGLYDLASAQRIARDDEAPAPESAWIDERAKRVQGIGGAASMWFPVAGLWGGALAQHNGSGWSAVVESPGRNESAVLRNQRSRAKWLVDKPLTEIKAFGFSASGRYLVLATSSDVTVYRCA
jgi:hypothetical protein